MTDNAFLSTYGYLYLTVAVTVTYNISAFSGPVAKIRIGPFVILSAAKNLVLSYRNQTLHVAQGDRKAVVEWPSNSSESGYFNEKGALNE